MRGYFNSLLDHDLPGRKQRSRSYSDNPGKAEAFRLLVLSWLNEVLDRHLGLPIPGMARSILSGEMARRQNASVLRGTISHHRDQLHLPENSQREDH